MMMSIITLIIMCLLCLSGMTLADCQISSEQCCLGYLWNKSLKQCEKCKSGFTGPSCNTRCPYPSYGLNCQQICNCIKSYCNFQVGCIRLGGCDDGFFGPICMKKCPYPTYGKECQKICKCDNETCDHTHGCIAESLFTISTNHDRIEQTSSKIPSIITKILFNESVIYNSNNELLAISTGSTKTHGNNIKNEETLIPRDNKLFTLVILSNIFLFLIVCTIFGLCIYCKRKWIIHKMFEVDKEENVYNGNGLYSKGRFSREHSQQLNKHPDFELDMANTMRLLQQNSTNDNLISVTHERNQGPDGCDNDPYLVPETAASESEFHQYLTVI